MKPWALLLLGVVLSPAAGAIEQNILYAKSQVSCASRQMGVPVEAEFKRFTAHVNFDPRHASDAKIEIEIATDSFEFDPEIDDEVKGKQWLDAGSFPLARFTATQIHSLGGNRYEAFGVLAIKGVNGNVDVPFTYQVDSNGGAFDGTFPISRLHYNIGDGKWRDTDTVADVVQVKFHLSTAKSQAKQN